MKRTTNKATFDIPKNYPFRHALTEQAELIKHSRKVRATYERVTVYEEVSWLPIRFIKFFQYRDAFRGLSPEACKIVVHIACYLESNSTRIQLGPRIVGISKYHFSSAILELMGAGILLKEKREWYWLNVAMLVNGDPHTTSEPNKQDTHGMDQSK